MFSSCSQHPKHVILVYHYNIPHFETVTMFHFWQKTPSGRMLSAPGIQKAQHTSRNPPISPATWSPNHQYLDAHPWNQRHPQENRIPITDTFWYLYTCRYRVRGGCWYPLQVVVLFPGNELQTVAATAVRSNHTPQRTTKAADLPFAPIFGTHLARRVSLTCAAQTYAA